jgi:hypothetical protein
VAKAKKKSAKEASNIFHGIMKASVQPPRKAITHHKVTTKAKTK